MLNQNNIQILANSPITIKGNWKVGWALDIHTIKE